MLSMKRADFQKTYQKMWYKNSNSFGIRQKFFAKRQIFAIRANGKPKEFLENVASSVIAKLESGELNEEQAQEWARAQCK